MMKLRYIFNKNNLGIPSVMIAGPGFVDQARYTALNNGVPVMRVAQYPGAFAAHTADELIRNTREILWPQIVEALTKPILDEERSAGIAGSKGDIRDDAFYGTIDEITGDAARNKVQTMPGGGYATIKIELPENWDSLMTELGYEPLESYSLLRR